MDFFILEGDCATRKRIIDIVNKICKEKYNVYNFNEYTPKLQKLVENIEKRKTFIIGNIITGEENSIDIAKRIRTTDQISRIIIISNNKATYENVYRTVPWIFDFINNYSNLETKLSEDIIKILADHYNNKLFNYNSKSLLLSFSFGCIKYIIKPKDSRKIIIYTDVKSYEVPMSLAEIKKLLDSRFSFTHRSCIANTDRICELNWGYNYFILDNGEKVEYLSKKYRCEIESSINKKHLMTKK